MLILYILLPFVLCYSKQRIKIVPGETELINLQSGSKHVMICNSAMWPVSFSIVPEESIVVNSGKRPLNTEIQRIESNSKSLAVRIKATFDGISNIDLSTVPVWIDLIIDDLSLGLPKETWKLIYCIPICIALSFVLTRQLTKYIDLIY